MPALAEKLKDPQPAIRREAVLALAVMDEAAGSAVPQIAGLLSDEHVRTAATYALGRIGRIPAEAEPAIRANAKSADKLLSTTSLWALARVHPEDKPLRQEVTERLVEGIKDANPTVRAAAARALAALPPAPEIVIPIMEKALQGADPTTVHHALDTLAAFGAQAVPRLIEALKHESLRAQVASVLGQIGPPAAPATAALANLLGDKHPHVATEAAMALAKIGPGASAAVPALVKAIEQPESEVAHACAFALGKIGPGAAAAEAALVKAVDGKDQLLALVSAWALVQIRPGSAEVAAKVVPVLTAGLSSPLPKAREAAAEALEAIRHATPKAAHDAAGSLRRGSFVVTVGESVTMRAGRDVVARLPKGTQLRVLEVRDPWVGVQMEVDGKPKTGWVLQKEVTQGN